MFLTIGAILASFIGTTDAAMLLIRPIIQTNKEKKYKEHTILFFIAIVANCRGLLTPLGDPPLFMMYLKGVPFTWEPIKEVAYLFLGNFITMVPRLLYLEYNAKSPGVNSLNQFYYFTGLLSSFLDTHQPLSLFYTLALGENAKEMIVGIPVELLEAVCVSALFLGSMTYIGNGPNLMIKSVAEENNIKMPSFFGYMFKFSVLVLLPVYILIQFIFI